MGQRCKMQKTYGTIHFQDRRQLAQRPPLAAARQPRRQAQLGKHLFLKTVGIRRPLAHAARRTRHTEQPRLQRTARALQPHITPEQQRAAGHQRGPLRPVRTPAQRSSPRAITSCRLSWPGLRLAWQCLSLRSMANVNRASEATQPRKMMRSRSAPRHNPWQGRKTLAAHPMRALAGRACYGMHAPSSRASHGGGARQLRAASVAVATRARRCACELISTSELHTHREMRGGQRHEQYPRHMFRCGIMTDVSERATVF